MWRAIKIVIVGMVVFAIIANRIIKVYSLEKYKACIGLIILGGLLYALNILLIIFFIRKRAQEFAANDIWELTAGTGIVPKWVSIIGLLSFSAFIVAVLPWIISLFK